MKPKAAEARSQEKPKASKSHKANKKAKKEEKKTGKNRKKISSSGNVRKGVATRSREDRTCEVEEKTTLQLRNV